KAEIEASADPAVKIKEIEERLEKLMTPIRSAETFMIEEIIDPRQTRRYLGEFVELAQPLLKTGQTHFAYRP
nr:methylmalonyl-CoA carboxyltransferase [Pseudomonas sp.]